MFKDIFKQLIYQNNLSAYQISKDTGISESLISQWKNGRQLPKYDSLKILADYFNVSGDYLLGRTDIPQIYSNNVIHTGDIKGNHNASINLKATSNTTKSTPSSDTSELVELIESLPLLKRAEAVIYLNNLKEKWINIQKYCIFIHFQENQVQILKM